MSDEDIDASVNAYLIRTPLMEQPIPGLVRAWQDWRKNGLGSNDAFCEELRKMFGVIDEGSERAVSDDVYAPKEFFEQYGITEEMLEEGRKSGKIRAIIEPRDSIERGLRAVLDEVCTCNLRDGLLADGDLPRLAEIFQKAAKE